MERHPLRERCLLIRFERERAAVDSLHRELECSQRTRLWAAAEFIATLRWQLDHLVGLCHHRAEFATVTLKLEGEHWCRQVQAALGQLTWGEVPLVLMEPAHVYPD